MLLMGCALRREADYIPRWAVLPVNMLSYMTIMKKERLLPRSSSGSRAATNFHFIMHAEPEMRMCLSNMQKCFSEVRVINVDKRASWYIWQD
jgi:hypothetical protein